MSEGNLTTNLVITLSLAFSLVLLLILIIQLTRRFGLSSVKGDDSDSRQWQNALASEGYGESPCEFPADSGSLVAVLGKVELAFPDLASASIQTTLPILQEQASSYFELEIISCPPHSTICFGLAVETSPSSLPGHVINSIGYSSFDGQLYSNGVLTRYSQNLRYGVRDVVGCGYFPRTNMVLFTKNGQKAAYIPFTSSSPLYPTVGTIGSSTLKANFGQKRFAYREANQNAWGFGVYSEMEVYDLPSPPPTYQEAETTSRSLPLSSITRRASFTPNPM